MLSSQTIRVLLLDPLPESAQAILESANWIIDTHFEDLSEHELLKKVSNYQIVCVARDRGEHYLTEDVLRSAHKLLAIGIFGSFDHTVNTKMAASMGIPVFMAPHQHQHSIAELVLSFLTLLARKVPDCSTDIHNQVWKKISAGCHEVRNKTLGIIGYGQIGSQLGVMAESLSLKVIFYDDAAMMPIGRAQPVNTLSDILKQSDFVTINVTNRPDNINLIGADELAQMKPGSYLINSSFGDAIDLAALDKALASGHIAGVALDQYPLFDQWKDSPAHALSKYPNVILTPRLGDKTVQAALRIGEDVANTLVHYIQDGTTQSCVNFADISAWPLKKGHKRIVNIHRSVRGVLNEIDSILSAFNVGKQVLDTKDGYGYLIVDIVTEELTTEIVSQLALLSNTVRTRIL